MRKADLMDYFIVLVTLFLVFASMLSGCSDDPTYVASPIQKPFITHNGESECVAIPYYHLPQGFSLDKAKEDYFDYKGFILLKCGMTPSEAADYQKHVEYALDYKP